MSIKFEKIQPGMRLWSKQMGRAGNTTTRRVEWHDRYVLEVDTEQRRVRVSVNGRSEWYPESRATKWYASVPGIMKKVTT